MKSIFSELNVDLQNQERYFFRKLRFASKDISLFSRFNDKQCSWGRALRTEF